MNDDRGAFTFVHEREYEFYAKEIFASNSS